MCGEWAFAVQGRNLHEHSLSFLCCCLYTSPGLHPGHPLPQSTGCVMLDKKREMLAMMFRETPWWAPFSPKWVLGHLSLDSAKAERRKKEDHSFPSHPGDTIQSLKGRRIFIAVSQFCLPHLQHPPSLSPVHLLKHSWTWNNQNQQKEPELFYSPLTFAMPRSTFSKFLFAFICWLIVSLFFIKICVWLQQKCNYSISGAEEGRADKELRGCLV